MTEPIYTTTAPAHPGNPAGLTEIPVTVHKRNNGFAVFVGGWRCATLKTRQGAIARANKEARVNPEWTQMRLDRAEIMESQGLPHGARVRVTTDAHPNIPDHCAFRAGDEGEVLLNMAHGPEVVSVRFDGQGLPHAIAAENLELI